MSGGSFYFNSRDYCRRWADILGIKRKTTVDKALFNYI